MEYLDTNSLAVTIDNVSEAMFFGLDIAKREKQAIADFFISRHYAPGTYANMFAPTETDMNRDLVLFTGEKVKSNAGRCHILGEEASRILRELNIRNEEVNKALKEADKGISDKIIEFKALPGTYCCKTCSCALWLNLAAGGLNNDTDMLVAGLQFLKQHREEKGTWKGFPYYYTLYVLNEIGTDLALDEMRFAAGSIERWMNRKPLAQTKFTLRRQLIGERILSVI